ncbi:MAG: hypothetical protein JXA44_10230 [Methanospirillaceae archaeon]|nr:hypothetical protein [Methanospirillaceae archaeon]
MDRAAPYKTLGIIADGLFARCEDDVSCIAAELDSFSEDIRDELLTSDLLNAYQVFYYYFRTYPDLMAEEILSLQPAGNVARGIRIGEIELLELVFSVREKKPCIQITDGATVLMSFTGRDAYSQAYRYIETIL